MACNDVSCRVNDKTSKHDQQTLTCSNPSCSKQYHILCAGWSKKKKSEIEQLVFVRLACQKFLNFSLSLMEEKMEAKIKLALQPLCDKVGDMTLCISDLQSKVAKMERIEVNYLNLQKKSDNIEDKIKKIEYELSLLKSAATPSSNDTTTHKQLPTADSHKFSIRISGLKEEKQNSFIERYDKDIISVKTLLNQLNVTEAIINDCARVGKFVENSPTHRKLIVRFNSVWHVRKIIANAHKLKDNPDKIFISPDLSDNDRIIEKNLLKKRWELIQSGVNRKDLKIRNLKLYQNDVEVNI